MQPQNEHAEMNQFGAGMETVACPSCRASMVRGMRFCRLCGYRLGEGVEEYAETRRFNGAPAATATHGARPTAAGAAPESAPQNWGAITPVMPTAPLGQFKTGMQSWTKALKCGRHMHWSMWIILSMVIMTATGGILSKPFRDAARGGASIVSAPRSYVGLVFEDSEEGTGAFIKSIRGVGSPSEQAGLIGGDIITSFDGQHVEGERDLVKLIRATPIGKAVEIEYLRDGETRRTTLTTASSDETDAFAPPPPPPGGEGFLGIDPSETERVPVPETNLHGVQLNGVHRNRPADIAGIREGDIVIEFNGVPVRTERDLLRRINQAEPGSIVRVILMRGKERLEIPVKMGRD